MAQGADGVLYVADTNNNRIRRVRPDGQVSTLAGSGEVGTTDGPAATARFTNPTAIAVDARGTVYVTDNYSQAIRKITPDGQVSTLPGLGHLVAPGAGVSSFSSLAVDAAGTLYVADKPQDSIYKITAAGVASALPGSRPAGHFPSKGDTVVTLRRPAAVAVGNDGSVYVAGASDMRICRIWPSGRVRVLAGKPEFKAAYRGVRTEHFRPNGLAVAANGTVYVADAGRNAIHQILPNGQVSTLSYVAHSAPGAPRYAFGPGTAAHIASPWGLTRAADGSLYVVAHDDHRITRLSPDGQLGTLAGAGEVTRVDGPGPTARFREPFGVAVAPGGTVYVADGDNHCIRKITPEGAVSTLAGACEAGFADGAGAAARFTRPLGVAVGPGDTVYVADTGNHRIRKISPRGQVSTLAGSGQRGLANGTGPAARFTRPTGVAVAANGAVYVADSADCIRRIAPNGRVGTAVDLTPWREPPGNAEGRVAPFGVAIARDGTLYITGSLTARVYKVTPKGKVSILAGCGPHCDPYEEPSGAPSFRNPIGVAVAPDGSLYVTDPVNNAVRHVTPNGHFSTLIDDSGRAVNPAYTGSIVPAQPQGVAVDAAGKVYIADTSNNRVLVVW
ncbi:hypothetical protein MTP16_25310 (plasmid) [Hymenobacter monticola]|uniref:SMP-30/Gluconolactonase/LRE-like region domain-containing protein n=2 Tax=Hymenobacter monticola TaxID=1705399 RepID=A0ABY4BCD7_9BACT|nr:hypothetical protein MTP16_25310 [Hymenobacter monticola]